MSGEWIEFVAGFLRSSQLAPVLLDAALKSFILLALAAGVALCCRRAAAATRHLVWLLTLVSLPFLPWLSVTLPSWQPAPWRVSTGFDSGNRFSVTLELAKLPDSAAAQPEKPASELARADSVAGTQPSASSRAVTARISENWLALLFAVWLGGLALILIRAVLARRRLGNVSRRAQPVKDAEWTSLLSEACGALGLRRPVVLLQSGGDTMPLTWGWWRPVVLLPAEAAGWREDRRRIVLLHELAHVKRWDCLTQWVARLVCALFWFNPLVWLAAQRMRVERERACDDLVLNDGCKASDYASHLVEIARKFRRVPEVAAIAMARPSKLERRVEAIVDGSRARRLRPAALAAVVVFVGVMVLGVGGYRMRAADGGASDSASLREQQLARLEVFSAAKEKQSQLLAAASGEVISPLFQRFFDAATNGDWQTVTNMYGMFKEHHPLYTKDRKEMDASLRTSYWQPVLEICLAYDQVVNGAPKYTQMAIDGIIDSVPPGSIYFGGTEAGRGLPTAFCKSQINGDPFYTIAQDDLANGMYQQYLRYTYGPRSELLDPFVKARLSDSKLQTLDAERRKATQKLYSLESTGRDDPEYKAADEAFSELTQRIDDRTRGIWAGLEARTNAPTASGARQTIYVPTGRDLQDCFQEYLAGARRRLAENRLKPGEHIKETQGRVQVSGRTALTEINALLAKVIFDKNPRHEFYVEESFPFDWMYPHLVPHGLILKLDRQPLAELPKEAVSEDHAYWRKLVDGMIGGWLKDKTPVRAVTDFAEKVYLRRDLDGFEGDPSFVQNEYACKFFSKERANIADLYARRANDAKTAEEIERMAREADFAYRQALALCPYAPEVVEGYADFLKSRNRQADAALVSQMAARFPSAPESDGTKSNEPKQQASNTAPVFQIRPVLKSPSNDAEEMTVAEQRSGGGTYHEIANPK